MIFHNSKIIQNKKFKEKYYKLVFYSPELIKEDIKPGQFLNIKIPYLKDKILMRPFSIFNTEENGNIAIIYKVVGEGTKLLSELQEGTFCKILGPLGNNFSFPNEEEIPVILAGSYGAAATYLLAKKSRKKGVLLLGAGSKTDLILKDDYEALGFSVISATEDGSFGYKGKVTELIHEFLLYSQNKKFYACGPNAMIYNLTDIFNKNDINAEQCFESGMCCGLGSCYTCALKIKSREEKQGWYYARVCKEGPVFSSKDIYVN